MIAIQLSEQVEAKFCIFCGKGGHREMECSLENNEEINMMVFIFFYFFNSKLHVFGLGRNHRLTQNKKKKFLWFCILVSNTLKLSPRAT